MNRREIDAYFCSLLELHELSPTAQYFVNLLMDASAPGQAGGEQILRTRQHVDRLGPITRITVALDACSGMRGEWVSAEELSLQAARDEFFMVWVDGLHASTPLSTEAIIGATVETWIALEMAGELVADVPIEMTLGPEGQLWRTVRRPIPDPEGTVGAIVDLLRHEHHGVLHSEVQGRLQISLPHLEVFIGVDLNSAAERRPGHEAPLVLSAITGMELFDSIDLDDLLDEFVNHVDTPSDLFFEVVRGVGLQVWMDKIIDGAEIDRIGLDRLVAEFLGHAHVLQQGLAPYDRNAPGGG